MFNEVKKISDSDSSNDDDEIVSGVAEAPAELDQDQDGSDDDLTEEQQKLVGKEILNSIKIFRKAFKLTEN